MEPVAPVLTAQSLNHYTVREVPKSSMFYIECLCFYQTVKAIRKLAFKPNHPDVASWLQTQVMKTAGDISYKELMITSDV